MDANMDDLINIYLISIFILIILSAIFACSETSITAASRAKAHRLASEGDKKAQKLETLLQNKEGAIGAMLIGNNAVNILASGLATSIFIKFFGEAGLIYATIIMTIIVLIFAEIAPKTLALKMPDKMAMFLAPVMVVLVKILLPLSVVIQKISNGFVKIFLPKQKKSSKEEELEEIRDTVDLKHQEGSIFKYDKDLIDGVLGLTDTEISEIMTHRKEMETINIGLSTAEFINQALSISHSRIPLWRDDKENIIGVLNVRKLLKLLRVYKGDIEAFNLAAAIFEPWFVPSTNSLRSQIFAFRKNKKKLAVVVDEYGSILGIITLEDILEEIVGEVKEDDDDSGIQLVKTNSGSYKIEGMTLIRDLNKQLNWNIPEDGDAYNLAAFVINHLGRMPEVKEQAIIGDYSFEILEMDGNDLTLLEVRKVQI